MLAAFFEEVISTETFCPAIKKLSLESTRIEYVKFGQSKNLRKYKKNKWVLKINRAKFY